MARAISNRNLYDARFEVAEFTGKWLESFGKPELRGSWLIYADSGAGKTHFALELIKYLSKFVDKVAYDTLEQGYCSSFQTAWKDANMAEIGSKVVVLNKEPIEELRERLGKRKSPDVIVIDSISALVGFTRPAFTKLINDFPNKLFIFIAHEKNGLPDSSIGLQIRKMSDVKVYIRKFIAYVTTRFRGENGEGGSDFIVWEEGARKANPERTF